MLLASSIACMIVLRPASIAAQASQSAAEYPVGLTASALISIYPPGYHGRASPYLDNALGGIVPGLSAAVGVTSEAGAHITLEISSTASIKVLQSGRFVSGSTSGVRQLATHRDTLVSVLPGVHVRLSPSGAALEPKGGFSLRLGTTTRGGTVPEDAGSLALTAGLDAVLPISARIALVPAFRYSYVARGDGGMYLGLSPHGLRIGAGVRFGLRR